MLSRIGKRVGKRWNFACRPFSTSPHEVLLVPGDGVGPEIVDCSLRAIDALGVNIKWTELLIGHDAWVKTGDVITSEQLEQFDKIPIILKGPLESPPEGSVITIRNRKYTNPNQVLRRHFQLFANVRPAKHSPGVKTPFVGLDLVVIRENTEGAYTGDERWIDENVAEGTQRTSRGASRRIARFTMDYAITNNRSHVTAVHKANLLKALDGLFIEECRKVAAKPKYKNIKYDEHLVDRLLSRLVLEPTEFDILLCPNLFGDLISDLASGLVGSAGLTASGLFGENHALFEPVHGSATDIAGKGIVNPVSMLRSAIMMLAYLGEKEAAEKLDASIDRVINEGKYMTSDLGGTASTNEMCHAIIQNL